GPRTVTVTTNAETVSLPAGFNVTAAGMPRLVQVSPKVAQQGQQISSVTLTGEFTHFVNGATTVDFGVGVIASSTIAEFSFAPPMTYSVTAPVLNNEGAFASADLNNDGLPDLVAATESGIVVLMNDGHGTFG